MHQTTLFDKDNVSQDFLMCLIWSLVLHLEMYLLQASNDACSEMASALSPFQQLATSPSKSENNLLKHL
jgi:hypothetical protein